MKIKQYQKRKHAQRYRQHQDTRIQKRSDPKEHRSHGRKRQKDSRYPDVHKRAHANRDPERKLFRNSVGQHKHERENFQTTRPANTATLHRLLSPFARITRNLRK